VALSDTLNEEQWAAYNEIMSLVDTDDGVSSLWMVLVGPKRLIYTKHFSLLYAVRKKIVVATATFGVTTSIMPGGRTAHLRFKILLTIDNEAFCTFME
jgi:hypothetical protein